MTLSYSVTAHLVMWKVPVFALVILQSLYDDFVLCFFRCSVPSLLVLFVRPWYLPEINWLRQHLFSPSPSLLLLFVMIICCLLSWTWPLPKSRCGSCEGTWNQKFRGSVSRFLSRVSLETFHPPQRIAVLGGQTQNRNSQQHVWLPVLMWTVASN